jgi:hypothetical protein
MVDYLHVQGMLRWTLIIVFMLLKAGLIVGVFMHMKWERLALKLAILVPPLCLLVLIGLMAIEGDYTFDALGGAHAQRPAPHRARRGLFPRRPDCGKVRGLAPSPA